MKLAEMRAERARLDAAIRAAEDNVRADWNLALSLCEDALVEWLRAHAVEYTRYDRKNVTSWNIRHGVLVAEFSADDGEHRPGLRVLAGESLTLEWSEVPELERFLAIVAVLLGLR